ncbi:hypothetical protein B0T22DRAFT_170359 [Podospora appendiculata]|uniref:Uncharacterized protein n=1 Tax=Podospora appendiculata TaxID=314037 RepID=A0AAE0XBE5_9PEZI|nr:hypothetical protein B0T22DRAFT_170359 [Podospora appendiculata]
MTDHAALAQNTGSSDHRRGPAFWLQSQPLGSLARYRRGPPFQTEGRQQTQTRKTARKNRRASAPPPCECRRLKAVPRTFFLVVPSRRSFQLIRSHPGFRERLRPERTKTRISAFSIAKAASISTSPPVPCRHHHETFFFCPCAVGRSAAATPCRLWKVVPWPVPTPDATTKVALPRNGCCCQATTRSALENKQQAALLPFAAMEAGWAQIRCGEGVLGLFVPLLWTDGMIGRGRMAIHVTGRRDALLHRCDAMERPEWRTMEALFGQAQRMCGARETMRAVDGLSPVDSRGLLVCGS